GQASGLQSTFRQLGSALGVAILGSLLIGTLGRATEAGLVEQGAPEQVATQVSEVVSGSAGAVIPSLEADPATAAAGAVASDAMIQASKVTTGVAAAIIALGLVATWALPESTARLGLVPPEARATRRRRRGRAADPAPDPAA
ncbi:MAG TPA: hypothetical protein VF143_02805, partial [Candidatus Nanopelagicales bacterium]